MKDGYIVYYAEFEPKANGYVIEIPHESEGWIGIFHHLTERLTRDVLWDYICTHDSATVRSRRDNFAQVKMMSPKPSDGRHDTRDGYNGMFGGRCEICNEYLWAYRPHDERKCRAKATNPETCEACQGGNHMPCAVDGPLWCHCHKQRHGLDSRAWYDAVKAAVLEGFTRHSKP